MQHIIRIEDPCDERWNNMTPNDNGRHCDRCCKTVVDFTDWPLEEIAQYLQEKGKGNVCGHFRASQLNTPFETPETLAEKVWQTSIPLYRKIAAVIILFFAVTISSCETNQTTGTPKQVETTTGAPKPETVDTGIRGMSFVVTTTYDTMPLKKHKKHIQKTPDTSQAQAILDPGEPYFQGAPELMIDTYSIHHDPAPKSDSTDK